MGFGTGPFAGLGGGFLGPLPWRIAMCGAFLTGRGLPDLGWSSPLLVARLNLTSGTGLPFGTLGEGAGRGRARRSSTNQQATGTAAMPGAPAARTVRVSYVAQKAGNCSQKRTMIR